MKRFFALVLLLVVVSPVAAQSGNSTDGSGVELRDPSADCMENIDNHTSICSVGTAQDGEVAVLTLWSDRPQRVTITDAGGLLEGGEATRKTATLTPEEKSRVSIPVTETQGWAVVSIDTGRTLYGKLIEQPDSVLPGSPGTWDPLVTAGTVFGLFAIALPASWTWLNRRSGGAHREL